MAVSDAGGANFGPNLVMNDDTAPGFPFPGFVPNGSSYSQPRIVFTPGRAGVVDSGGNMVVLWTNNDPSFPTIHSDSRTFRSVATPNGGVNVPQTAELTGPNLPIGIVDAVDPGNSAPHIPGITIYPFNVGSAAGVTHVDAISVALNIQHDALEHVRIELLPPHITNAATTGTLLLIANA